ncbi:MAG: TonB-dependent receptor, partial [Firmicutes bacterium]|nr:TonB-dependent receptor [Bacillota bacterium]
VLLRAQYFGLVREASSVALTGQTTAALGGAPIFITTLAPLPASFVALNSLRGNYPISEGTSLWTVRIDHRWNEENNTFVRASVAPSLVTGIQVNAQNQNFGQNAGNRTSRQQFRDLTLVGQHVTAFSPTLFNEARAQFARRGLHYGFSDLPGGDRVAVNIPGFAFFGREPFSTVDRIERRTQVSDNVSWIVGTHTIKFGGDFNLIQLRSKKEQIFELNFGGLFNFGGLSATALGFPAIAPGFTAVQAYGMGLPQVFVQGLGNSNKPFNNYVYAFFLQDSWKIHPRLTLNLGVRYDYEHTPLFAPGTQLNADAEAVMGVVEGIPRDKNNVAPRVALAWDPWGDAKTVIRAGYGLFYDHPLLAVAFNSTTAEGALSTQLITFGGSPSTTSIAVNPAALNATNIFQGILNTTGVPNTGYLPNQQRFDPKLPNSIFVNQNFITAGFPIAALPFTLHVDGDFAFGYAQQANLTVERQLWRDYKFSIGYTWTKGTKLNRPRNINPPDPGLLVRNAANAIQSGLIASGTDPRQVVVPTGAPNACVNTAGGGSLRLVAPGALATGFSAANCAGPPVGFVGTAAFFNFFRPSGPNPSFAALAGGFSVQQALATLAGYPTGFGTTPIPWGDVVQQESSGSSTYHGMTVNFSKRFSNHFEFLSSWTYSHTIDDSTDLQTLLAPQDNRRPDLERSSSTFDQRHRWVTSAVLESPFRRTDDGFWQKLLADFTVAPIFEITSGRPFTVLTGTDFNLDFGSNTDRPSVGTGTVTSPFLPGVNFGPPSRCDVVIAIVPAPPFGCTGNLGRNTFTREELVIFDLRISRRFWFTDRFNLEFITDVFNLFNRFNVGDVNPLCNPVGNTSCTAGEPTAALDPRQFQFALKLNW